MLKPPRGDPGYTGVDSPEMDPTFSKCIAFGSSATTMDLVTRTMPRFGVPLTGAVLNGSIP